MMFLRPEWRGVVFSFLFGSTGYCSYCMLDSHLVGAGGSFLIGEASFHFRDAALHLQISRCWERFSWGSSRGIGSWDGHKNNRSRAKNLYFVVTLKSKHMEVEIWNIAERNALLIWAFSLIESSDSLDYDCWTLASLRASRVNAIAAVATVFYIFWCFR